VKKKIIIAITGASGAIYAKLLLDRLTLLMSEIEKVDIIFSKNAIDVWKYEIGDQSYKDYSFNIIEPNNFFTGPASGSAGYSTMIIAPASMGTLGRIASGISNDLITRAADVMLKERKQLIVVPRETPYNLIHLRNLTTITEAGGIVLPASPSFYNHPKTVEDVVNTVVDRILKLAGFNNIGIEWGS